MRKLITAVFITMLTGISPIISIADQLDNEEIIKLKQQIHDSPNDSQAHSLLGIAYGKIGRDQEAMDELKEAIRLKSSTNSSSSNKTIQSEIKQAQSVLDNQSNPSEKDEEQKLNSNDKKIPRNTDIQNTSSNKTSDNELSNIKTNNTITQFQDKVATNRSFDLTNFILDLKREPLLLVFISVMLIVGIYIHVFAFTTKAVALGPTFFTTLGIFGTFLGIAIGLWKVDPDNMQASIPNLLGGLTMAFWASVTGIFFALTLKARFAILGASHKDGEVYGATIDDLVGQMKDVQQAIVGNDDSTLLTQMKLARQDVNDRLDSLKRSQEAFMEKMADNNSKALIEALKEVIKDFNTKINEQFGENFKQLNLAVGKILEWQENYRQQMAEMIEQQKITVVNMATATASYKEHLDSAKIFWDAVQNLVPMINTLNTQREQIERSLLSLGQLLTTASGSLPAIENKIMELIEQMTRGVQTSNEIFSKSIRETIDVNLITMKETQKMLTDMLQKSNQELNTHITGIINNTQEQVKNLDIALDTELNNSLKTLGQQLAALSGKFVEDYKPLTEKLQKLIDTARGLN